MAKDIAGGCQCGNIRYRLEGGPFEVVACHCLDCQRQSGSAFGMSLIVKPEAFVLISGKLKNFIVTTESGRIKTCAFCPVCGSRIHHRSNRGMSVKAGTLDDTSGLKPTAHYWTKRKQPWVVIPEGVRQVKDDG
jgi:hypothetical protein